MYAKFYQNIPLSSRDRAIFTFSEFEPRQRLGQSQMTFDNPLGYILPISMHMQKFIKKFQTVSEVSTFFTNRPATKSSQTVQGQNLHKLSGDKIKCLIIGHSVKFNFKFQVTFLGSCNHRVWPSCFITFQPFYCQLHLWYTDSLIKFWVFTLGTFKVMIRTKRLGFLIMHLIDIIRKFWEEFMKIVNT